MEIKPEEIIIQTYRKTWKSGWVPKLEDCVKLYHIPTGIMVVAEESGSVCRNKVIALRKLEEELCWIQYEEEV